MGLFSKSPLVLFVLYFVLFYYHSYGIGGDVCKSVGMGRLKNDFSRKECRKLSAFQRNYAFGVSRSYAVHTAVFLSVTDLEMNGIAFHSDGFRIGCYDNKL